VMLSIIPAADPFWLMADVADAAMNPVNAGSSLSPTMSHVHVLAAAPLLQAGVVIAMSAGAAPLTCVSTPEASKVTVPLPPGIGNGVPGVPPEISPPGTEMT